MATDFSKSKVYGTKRVWPAENLPPEAPAEVVPEDSPADPEGKSEEVVESSSRRRRRASAE